MADFDGSAVVEFNDFTPFGTQWRNVEDQNPLEADLDSSGIVDRVDLTTFAAQCAPVTHQRDHLYVSNADGTTPGAPPYPFSLQILTSLMPCTGTLLPSEAIHTLKARACRHPDPTCRLFRGAPAADSTFPEWFDGRLTSTTTPVSTDIAARNTEIVKLPCFRIQNNSCRG